MAIIDHAADPCQAISGTPGTLGMSKGGVVLEILARFPPLRAGARQLRHLPIVFICRIWTGCIANFGRLSQSSSHLLESAIVSLIPCLRLSFVDSKRTRFLLAEGVWPLLVKPSPSAVKPAAYFSPCEFDQENWRPGVRTLIQHGDRRS
jgi:hypothetical protein